MTTLFGRYVVAPLFRLWHSLTMSMNAQPAHNDWHLQQATGKIPPAWSPADQRRYSFRHWLVDLRLWTAATDIDPIRWGPMIAMRLGGAARDMVREMDPGNLAGGRIIPDGQGGQVAQPGYEYLIELLTRRFAPLEQEVQLEAISELFHWRRTGNDTYDECITRFEIMVFRTQMQGGIQLAPPIKSWMLLNALHVPRDRWATLLTPTLGMLPQTDAEYTAFLAYLRRSGHLYDGTSDRNIRGGAQHQQYFQTPGTDDGNDSAWPIASSFPVMPYDGSAYLMNYDDDDLSSGHSEPDEPIDVSDVLHLSPNDAGEALYLAYRGAKRRFRSFSKSGPRNGKGKGRGKKGGGKGKFRGKPIFYADGTIVEEFEEPSDSSQSYPVFEVYYGKGKGKGKTSPNRRNPIGADGKIMTCSLCGSESHFQRFCTKGKGKGSSSASSSSPGKPSNYLMMPPGAQEYFQTLPSPTVAYLSLDAALGTSAPGISVITYANGFSEELPAPSPTSPDRPQTFYTFFATKASAAYMWLLPATSAYHAQVRLREGEGLLVDCGAVQNLTGDRWIARIRSILQRFGQGVSIQPLAEIRTVEGVGSGSSQITTQASVPICVESGSTGVFQTSIVSDSDLPALLGLEALVQQRALIDTYNNKLLLIGPGGYNLKLPPGSESLNLVKISSGHLMLPVTEWARVKKSVAIKSDTLFTPQ